MRHAVAHQMGNEYRHPDGQRRQRLHEYDRSISNPAPIMVQRCIVLSRSTAHCSSSATDQRMPAWLNAWPRTGRCALMRARLVSVAANTVNT